MYFDLSETFIDMLRPASGELTAIDSGVASTDIGVDGVLLGVMSIPPAPLCVSIRLLKLNLGGVEIRLAAENVKDFAAEL